MKYKLIYIFLKILFFFFFTLNLSADNKNYFNEGKNLFKNNKYDEAKFKFEKDLVFNPKNENSYLYLAKIFHYKKNNSLEEKNLNTVILLNPKNEEAVVDLAKLRIKNSNYSETTKLIETLEQICVKLCSSVYTIKKELSESQK